MGEEAKRRQVDTSDAEARLQRHKQMVAQSKQFNSNVRIAVVFIVGFLLGTASIAMLYKRDFSSVNSLRETVLDNKVTKPTLITIEEADGTEVIRKKVQDVKGLVKPKKLPVQKKSNYTSTAAPRPSMRGSNSTIAIKPKTKPASASEKALPPQPKDKQQSNLGIDKDKIPLDSTKSIKPVGLNSPNQIKTKVGTAGGTAFPAASRPKNDEEFLKMIQNKPADTFSKSPGALGETAAGAGQQKAGLAPKAASATKAKADADE